MTDAAGSVFGGRAYAFLLAGLQKDAARIVALALRDRLHARRDDAGAALAALAPAALFSEPGRVVSGYWPMQSEMDPRPLMARFAEAGSRLALPRVPEGRVRGPLAFHLWTLGEDLVPGPFGLMQPRSDAPTVDPDLLLVPLLAFDDAGGRLGYGGGYYDRTLEALRARKRILALGVAFAGQAADVVPTGAHDQGLDGVLTETGLRRFTSAAAGEAPTRPCDTDTA